MNNLLSFPEIKKEQSNLVEKEGLLIPIRDNMQTIEKTSKPKLELINCDDVVFMG